MSTGKRSHGGGAIATAVVEEDDGAAELRLGLHHLQLVEDRLSDFGGVLRTLIPVVGVDLVADDGVSFLLNAHDRRGLIVGVGLLVDVVGRAEVERLHTQLAGKEAFGELDFEVEPALAKFR